MARLSLVWTALPAGYTADRKQLRLTVLLTPRLDPEAAPAKLGSFFPDLANWPATIASARFEVNIGGMAVLIAAGDLSGLNRADDALSLADSVVWQALFKADRFVRAHAFSDYAGHRILSYDTAAVASAVLDLYSELAASADDDLPRIGDLLEGRDWIQLVAGILEHDRRSVARETGMRDIQRQFAQYQESASNQRWPWATFELFHTPPAQALVRSAARTDDRRITARWREHAKQTLPSAAQLDATFDFHQIVAALGAYPVLLRKTGLAIDLLLDAAAFVHAANTPLRVKVRFRKGSFTLPLAQASPITRTRLSADRFDAVPTGLTPLKFADGLLDLAASGCRLEQLDVDGAGLKLVNFARSLARRIGQVAEPVMLREAQVGPPALRTAGLTLVQSQRSAALRARIAAGKTGNAAVEGELAGGAPAELHAEDLLRGFRFDIWDGKTGVWRSLCRRHALYELEGGLVVRAVPEEETTVRAAATASSDPTTNTDLLYHHEMMMSWTGWSLAAPPPGRAVLPDDSIDPATTATEPEPLPGITFRSSFRAVPGTLPRLRFGRRYAVRARTVDLASNALAPQEKDFGPERPGSHTVRFLRFEPIAPPVIALLSQGGAFAAPGEGESIARVAIRSFNDTPADDTLPSAQRTRRAAAPPQVSTREAEQHGVLDIDGKVAAGVYAMLAHEKDVDPREASAAIREEVIETKGPLSGAADTTFAVYEAGRALTYLPDPLATACAVRFFGHPGLADSTVLTIPLYADAATWPDALPFEIEIGETPESAPAFDPVSRRLRVPLPKAAQVRLRLSMKPTDAALDLLAIFALLGDAAMAAQRPRARAGQHWMLSPWRELELVHAVQRPLSSPDIVALHIDRVGGATSARPVLTAACHLDSTARLDLRAEWHEPRDPVDAEPGDITRTDVAFAVKITRAQEYGDPRRDFGAVPEHAILGADRIGINQPAPGVHMLPVLKAHEFHDTRYRRVAYRFVAVSRFREFLPSTLLLAEVDGAMVPTDAHIRRDGAPAIGWVPNAAPPPPPSVLYVLPTFAWSRRTDDQGRAMSERRGGLRIYLDRGWNASGYGEMLAIVLPPARFAGDPDSEPLGEPCRTYVTQWGNDPIWRAPFVTGIAPARGDFALARLAPDPAGAWLPPGAPPDEAGQPAGPFHVTDLPLSGIRRGKVDIAPHDVAYDSVRGLWYCDVEIDTASYFPFIRLALARYQPVSVAGAWLSPVVLADMIALTPDRWLSITAGGNGTERHLTLYGPHPSGSSGHDEAAAAPIALAYDPLLGRVVRRFPASISESTVVEVWIERLHEELGEDFGWIRVPPAMSTAGTGSEYQGLSQVGVATVITPPTSAWLQVWTGSIAIPDPQGRRQRLVIAEFEEYIVDDSMPYDKVPQRSDRRMVFVEHHEIVD